MAEQEIRWEGESGKKYKYWISEIAGPFKHEPGNYIFVRETTPNRFRPLYIGESGDLGDRLTSNHEKLPCVLRNGGTHICTHTTSGGEKARLAEETDLKNKWGQVC